MYVKSTWRKCKHPSLIDKVQDDSLESNKHSQMESEREQHRIPSERDDLRKEKDRLISALQSQLNDRTQYQQRSQDERAFTA